MNLHQYKKELWQPCYKTPALRTILLYTFYHGPVSPSKILCRGDTRRGDCPAQLWNTGEILILGYTNPGRAKDLHKYGLMQSLIDYPYAIRLNSQGYRLKVHIKVDTGKHKLGFDFSDTGAIARTFRLRNLSVCGIFSHLCTADSREEDDIAFTQEQIMNFYEAIDILKKQIPRLPKIHIQSSCGFLNYPERSASCFILKITCYSDKKCKMGRRLRIWKIIYCPPRQPDRDTPCRICWRIPPDLIMRPGICDHTGLLCMVIGRVCMD